MSIEVERIETGLPRTRGPNCAGGFDRNPWLWSLLSPVMLGDGRRGSAYDGAVHGPDRRDVRDHRVCGLRREAVVVAQDAAEARATCDRCGRIVVLVGRRRNRGDQPVVEALVVALEVIVLDELGDREAEVALAEGNELVEALGLDGEHEAFRERVQVWTSSGELEALDTCSAENRVERVGEQRVAVVKQVALALQKAVDVVDEVARDLLEPCAVRFADHAGDLNAATLEVDHEQDDVSDETAKREDLDVKKSVAAITPKCALRNVLHGIVLPRLGAGTRPCSARMRLIVFRPSS